MTATKTTKTRTTKTPKTRVVVITKTVHYSATVRIPAGKPIDPEKLADMVDSQGIAWDYEGQDIPDAFYHEQEPEMDGVELPTLAI